METNGKHEYWKNEKRQHWSAVLGPSGWRECFAFWFLMTDLKSLKSTEEFYLKKNEALQKLSNLWPI